MFTTVFDYLKWRGDLTFKQDKMNIIDIFILCLLPIIDFNEIIPTSSDKITLNEAFSKYLARTSGKQKLGLIIPSEYIELFSMMASSKRFKNVLISQYFEIICIEKEEQICAMTFHIDDKILVCYSGTDDTIVGWKENFNMMYLDYVPAQLDAMEYSRKIEEEYKQKIIFAGHSKGGNLAVFGALGVKPESIEHIFAFDFPGVSEKILESKEYQNILPKITSVIPETSVVGMLFNHQEKRLVTKSNKEGFYQHDPLSWNVLGNDFVYIDDVSKDAKSVDNKIKSILQAMDNEQKKVFSESIYKLFKETGAKRLIEFEGKEMLLITAYFKITKDDKKIIRTPLLELIKERSIQKIIFQALKEYRKIQNKM